MAKPLEMDQQWLDRIVDQVSGLQYGQVTITVHDGRIVQIDRTERTRYDNLPQKQKPQPEEQRPKASGQPVDGDTLRIVQ